MNNALLTIENFEGKTGAELSRSLDEFMDMLRDKEANHPDYAKKLSRRQLG